MNTEWEESARNLQIIHTKACAPMQMIYHEKYIQIFKDLKFRLQDTPGVLYVS